MFKRKGRLRKQVNRSLMETVNRAKEDWLRQKEIVEKSIEPHDVVLHELKLAEARYFFLLREARVLFSDKLS
ncbi:MAG TPA: YaaL family protein [Bacillales bacterium]|nr:YaaL family protein [Bacillales bacterium]